MSEFKGVTPEDEKRAVATLEFCGSLYVGAYFIEDARAKFGYEHVEPRDLLYVTTNNFGRVKFERPHLDLPESLEPLPFWSDEERLVSWISFENKGIVYSNMFYLDKALQLVQDDDLYVIELYSLATDRYGKVSIKEHIQFNDLMPLVPAEKAMEMPRIPEVKLPLEVLLRTG